MPIAHRGHDSITVAMLAQGTNRADALCAGLFLPQHRALCRTKNLLGKHHTAAADACMVLEVAFALHEFTLPPPDSRDQEQGMAATEWRLRMARDLAGEECARRNNWGT